MQYMLTGYNWDLSNQYAIPYLLLTHVYLTGVSMGIALLIAIPVSLLVARYDRLYLPVITGAGILYTIPSLAALAFLIPVTGLTATTVIIPLALYAQVTLIRNIVAALRAVDPALIDVGRAMGMSERQIQLRVVVPLALPVIIAGVRVATVTTIGIASIGPLVGVEDLGYPIFDGIFGYPYPSEVLAGVILVSALAVAADLLLLALQRQLSRGQRIVPARQV